MWRLINTSQSILDKPIYTEYLDYKNLLIDCRRDDHLEDINLQMITLAQALHNVGGE
jgi:hypothetical protein